MLSNAALGLKLENATARTTVQMSYNTPKGLVSGPQPTDPVRPQPIVLCSLSGGMVGRFPPLFNHIPTMTLLQLRLSRLP